MPVCFHKIRLPVFQIPETKLILTAKSRLTNIIATPTPLRRTAPARRKPDRDVGVNGVEEDAITPNPEAVYSIPICRTNRTRSGVIAIFYITNLSCPCLLCPF